MERSDPLAAYWSRPHDEVVGLMASSPEGIRLSEAEKRLNVYGRNDLSRQKRYNFLRLLASRFQNPLLLILIFAALIAVLVHDWLDAVIVLCIIFISAVLSGIQEYRASCAVEKLRQQVATRATVKRAGRIIEIQADEVVPGDIILLSAGSLIPADCLLLESNDLFVGQAILTGETFPVEKQPGVASFNATITERSNCLFMGTSVRSGTGIALVVQTGRRTVFGQISDTMNLKPPETEFERGLRHFGGLLMWVMVMVVLAVLTINIVLQRPTIDTLLFAMALAVGLSPELLPAILTVTLCIGAKKMAAKGVIIRHLNAIENLGSMDVLCTDKTGTLTQGIVNLDSACDPEGQACHEVLELAYLNSRLQTGLKNPLDEAVIAQAESVNMALDGYRKIDEIPYDFVRKRLSIIVQKAPDGAPLMITKGALRNVLDVCDSIKQQDLVKPLDDTIYAKIQKRFAGWSERGYRVLGLALKDFPAQSSFDRQDEQGMTFVGFLLFFDPPKPEVKQTLASLRQLGIQLKIITGDSRLVAQHIAEAVGMEERRVITGPELSSMRDEALWHLAPQVSIFAEVDPNQKERIIYALQKSGHVVGYLGDGINDAPALHAADVGISVDKAVDVAREAADIVLVEHSLDVIRNGVEEGRRTFINTIKYIFITTSANFGNMISMALASLFLPFLPMLAKQILLNNFLSDIPAMGIAGDNVDRDWVHIPHRWNMRLIKNSMLTFGLMSTTFDIITFGALLYLVGETPELFRTGWFIESLLTELFILLIIRTRKPFYKSHPGRFLLWSVIIVTVLTLFLPYLPLRGLFGFQPLSPEVLAVIIFITATYIVLSELTKRSLYSRFTSW